MNWLYFLPDLFWNLLAQTYSSITRLCEARVGNWSPVQMAWVVAAVMDVKGTLGDHSVVVIGIGLLAMVNMDITGAFPVADRSGMVVIDTGSYVTAVSAAADV